MTINVPTSNTNNSQNFIEINEKDLLREASQQIESGQPSKAALMIKFVISNIAREQDGSPTEKKVNKSIKDDRLQPIDIYNKDIKKNPSLETLFNKALDEIVQDSFSHPSKLKDRDGEDKADKTFGSFAEQYTPKEENLENKPKGIDPINYKRRDFLKNTAILTAGALTGGGTIASLMKTKNNEENKDLVKILNDATDKKTGKIDWGQAIKDTIDPNNHKKSHLITVATIGAASSGAILYNSHKNSQHEYKNEIIGEVFDAIDHRIDLELQGVNQGQHR